MSDAGPWITPTAQPRLAENAQGTCFTSDLSVDEFVLVHKVGFEPLGVVVGSSMFHVGIQIARWSQSTELDTLTQAMYGGRELAMQRMTQEAKLLGADGVVGVDVTLNVYAGGQEVMEFLATGTAVRSRTDPGKYVAPSGLPFTSDLSGQDFYKLMHAGWLPTSFVFGTCVYHVAHQGAMQSLRQVGKNVEMPQYTQAVYDARELAIGRLQNEGERAGGRGVVGVRLTHHNHIWGEHAIEFLGVGTAVRPLGASTEMTEPTLVLNL